MTDGEAIRLSPGTEVLLNPQHLSETVMGTYVTKTSRQSRLSKVLGGLGKHLSNVTITLGGASYAYLDLKKLIEADLQTMIDTAKAQADYRVQVQVERNSHAKVNAVLRLLKNYVIALFGDTVDASSQLDDFGYSPRTSSKKTLQVKVEAAGKAKATRGARHTLGKKQKAKIKGTVPADSPAAPAPNPKA
jgi:hypothetical protein